MHLVQFLFFLIFLDFRALFFLFLLITLKKTKKNKQIDKLGKNKKIQFLFLFNRKVPQETALRSTELPKGHTSDQTSFRANQKSKREIQISV